MKDWKKFGYYRQGVVYARGNERKVIIPNHPILYLKLDTQEVWWHQKHGRHKTIGLVKDT